MFKRSRLREFTTSVIVMQLLIFSQSVKAQTDPTRPLGLGKGAQQVSTKGALTLESIIHREQGKVAIVSGKMLKVGDEIGAYKVHAIGDKTISLVSPDREVTLSLFSDVVINSK